MECDSRRQGNNAASFRRTRAVQPVATCRQSPYLHKPAVVIVTSFATELATPTVTDVPTLCMYGRNCV